MNRDQSRRFRGRDGSELAYSERGSGQPALVFVHGWQGTRSVWDRVIDALAHEVRVVAVDLRGSGESKAAPGPYRLERFAADLYDLVEQLGIAPVVLVGHSMGAKVALRFALDHPQETRALVLIAPVASGNANFSPKGQANLRGTAGNPAAARTWLGKTLARPNDEALDHLSAAAASTRSDAVLESLESWMHTDIAEATRGITAPALVIAPELDAPAMQEERVAALLPNSRYELLLECAHYAILEKPAEVAELIRQFIRER